MKVVINGNVATVKSDKIKYADLLKAKFATATDENGKIIYRAFTERDGSITNQDIGFTFADADGFAAMNIVVEGVDMLDKDLVMEAIGPELCEFKNYEEALTKDIEAQLALRTEIEADITIQ